MVLVLGRVFRLLQGTFEIRIYDKRDALLPAVVLNPQRELPTFRLNWNSVGICKRNIIFLFSRRIIKIFYNFYLMYTYRLQKNFLCSYLLSCELTRRDRFFIHAKCPTSSSFCTLFPLSFFPFTLLLSLSPFPLNSEYIYI